MVPLLAPLLGSLAGSMLPATLGTGIASAIGLGGTAAGGLIAAAAPKAIGAGIGTLLGGGDLGDAALNAVGFGAAGALMPGAAAAAGAGAGAGAGAAAPAGNLGNVLKAAQAAQGLMGGNQSPPPAAPALNRPTPVANSGPGGAMGNLQPGGGPPVSAALTQMNAPIPTTQVAAAMPPAVGIGTLPGINQQPLSSDDMMTGMDLGQRNMAGDYLRSQGMVGFV